MDLDNKKEKYYDWLVNHLLENTEIFSRENGEYYISFNYVDEWTLDQNGKQTQSPILYRVTEPWNKSSFLYSRFRQYLEEKMGVVNGLESKEIWDRYSKKLWDNIRETTGMFGGRINESEDKKEKLLDFIVNDLFTSTSFKYKPAHWLISGFYVKPPYSTYLTPDIVFLPKKNENSSVNFKRYIINKYGVRNKNVINDIWYKYCVLVYNEIKRLKSKNNINESEDKNERFLKFVIDDLKRLVRLGYDDWFVNYYHCSDCNESWEDEWSAMTDDVCPTCKTTYSPFHSVFKDQIGNVYINILINKLKQSCGGYLEDFHIISPPDCIERHLQETYGIYDRRIVRIIWEGFYEIINDMVIEYYNNVVDID